MTNVGAPGNFGSALDWLALVVWLLLVYWQPSVSFGRGGNARRRRLQYDEGNAAADGCRAAPASPPRGTAGGGGDGGGGGACAQRRRPMVSSGTVLLRLVTSPPGWLFGLVWPVLHALMGVALFVYWRRASPDIADPAARLELRVTTFVAVLVNLVLNKLWTPLYFDANQRAVALVVALGILATNIWVLVEFFSQPDRASQTAGYLWLPYAVWSAYAVFLNALRVGRRRTLI